MPREIEASILNSFCPALDTITIRMERLYATRGKIRCMSTTNAEQDNRTLVLLAPATIDAVIDANKAIKGKGKGETKKAHAVAAVVRTAVDVFGVVGASSSIPLLKGISALVQLIFERLKANKAIK